MEKNINISQRTKLILSKVVNNKENTPQIIAPDDETDEFCNAEGAKANDMNWFSSDYSDEDPNYVPSATDSENESVIESLSRKLPTSKRKVTKIVKVGRKRVRNEKEWIDNKAKTELNKGSQHNNRKDKLIPAKLMKSSCKETCRLKCNTKLNEETRKVIFEEFWKLGDHSRQWDFLVRSVTQREKKQVTVKNKNSRRNFSRDYKFTINNEEIKICKIMFLNTLAISETFVNTALQKVGAGGTVEQDKRGKHNSRPHKNPEHVIQSIIDHIKRFPLVPSHYTRKTSERMYLEEGLHISRMHRLYLEYAQQNNWDDANIATLRQYRDTLNSRFNIAFFKPKKDQCSVCSAYKNTDPAKSKGKMEEDYNRHLLNKTTARNLKYSDKELSKNDKSILTVCFDLQKVLVTPQSEISDFYYKSKIATYNFTIYDLGNNQGYCYVWHEQISKRGPNEIGSCLWNFFKDVQKKGIKKVILYSDNCGGQNRNRFIFSMYAYASVTLDLEITHGFLEKGHTQNENDSMHAVIEIARKRHSAIYSPDQWISLIKMAKVNFPQYKVKEMSQEDFVSFKLMVEKQNWKKDSSGQVVKISEIRNLHFDPKSPNTVFFAYNFNEAYKEIYIKRNNLRQKPEEQYQLPKLYTGLLPIDSKKLKGLLDLCKANLIPPMYHAFYNSLKSTTKANHQEEMQNDSSDHEESE